MSTVAEWLAFSLLSKKVHTERPSQTQRVEFACSPRAYVGFPQVYWSSLPLKTYTIGQDECESVCEGDCRTTDENYPKANSGVVCLLA